MVRGLFAASCIGVLTAAAPALAQTPSDACRATIEEYFAAFNSGNLPTVTELWRADAIEINVRGLMPDKTKRDAHFADDLKLGVKFAHKIDRIEVDDQLAWVAGPYTVTVPSKDGGSTEANGNCLHVLRQEGGTWKLQAASWTRTDQPKKE